MIDEKKVLSEIRYAKRNISKQMKEFPSKDESFNAGELLGLEYAITVIKKHLKQE